MYRQLTRVARILAFLIFGLCLLEAAPAHATATVVTSVGVPADGAYGPGQTLAFTVNFSAPVTVTGTPFIPLSLDVGGTVHASYVSGSGTSTLSFQYIVISGETDTNGITIGSALALNGGTILDGSSSSAVLTLNGVPSTTGVLVDTTPPTPTGMTVPANGIYGAGQALTFTVAFSEAVIVTGTPQLPITLDIGGTVSASYLSGSGTSNLTFQYVVVSGEQDFTGIVTGTSINSNGGTIRDTAGNNASLAINAVEPSTAGIFVNAIPAAPSVPAPMLDRWAILLLLGLIVFGAVSLLRRSSQAWRG